MPSIEQQIVLVTQIYAGAGDVGLKVGHAAGAWNRKHGTASPQKPCERNLTRLTPVFGSHLFANAAKQNTASDRGPRYKPDADRFAVPENVLVSRVANIVSVHSSDLKLPVCSHDLFD